MHSIRKILTTAFILIATTILLGKLFYYIYEPHGEMVTVRRMDFQRENGKIEAAIFGTSLAMNGFNPEIFDEKLGLNTFNFATSKQSLESSYYLLEQIDRDNPLEMVVINISGATLKETDSEAENYARNKAVWDAYYTLETKFRRFFDLYGMKEYEKALMYSFNMHDSNLISLSKISNNTYYKNHEDELWEKKPEKYAGKGHIGNTNTIKRRTKVRGKYIIAKSFDEEETNEDNMKYLKKILSYCQENEIRMVMVTTPPSPMLNRLLRNKKEMYAFYSDLAKEYDAEYYYYSEEELESIYDTPYYFEWSHLNTHGAQILSNDVCDWLLEEGN